MATLKDVAEKSGVTITTVSRVLNNRGYIGEKTRVKVYEAMKELNYQPNEVARSLSTKNTKIIGVIVPSVMHPFFSKVVNYVEQYASKQNYKVMVCNSNHELEKEKEYISILNSNKVAGMIISSRTPNIEKYLNLSFPVVLMERETRSGLTTICCDNYRGGVLATEHLIQLGCRNLLMFGGVEGNHLPADLRYEGFRDISEAHGVTYTMYQTREDEFLSMNYGDSIEHAILESPQVDGIFASSDVIAARVLQSCARHGLSVPGQVKVIGFDDVDIASLTVPQITTIRQPIEEMSSHAVDTIIRHVDKKVVPSRIELPVVLVRRETT